MGRFDFGEEQPPQPPQGYRTIGGTYQCQQCNKRVRKARYYSKESRLAWTCDEGHESELVGFSI